MTEEELARSPVIRMAGSDGEIYEATADLASEMATAAREAGVALKPFVKTTDAEGNLHEISPFDGAALKEAEERGDKRHFEGNAEEDYFSVEALKAGAARFAIGIVNPLDWLRGIGTATGTVVRGLAKGTVGLVLKAGSALETAGASIDDAIHNAELEEYKRKSGYSDKEWERILKERPEEFGLEKREEGAFHKAERKFNEIVDAVTPDVFELTGEYDGVDGAKESTGAVRSVAEMVANVKGIGKLTNLMQANGASARLAHAATGAMFGAGKYDDVANDPNGPGGWKQQAAAIAAGTADAVIFGLWNPFKISAKYAAELKPFAEATRREVTKRVLVRLGQAFESGASMATVEAVKQGAEQLAGIGMTTDGASGGPEPLPEDEATKTWGERTLAESAKEVGAQFLVGSAFAALDVAEANIGRFSYNRVRKAQGEDIGEGMKVAMSYQVERNRKAICPKYHEQAIYAYNMFVKQGGKAQSFRDGFSMGPDVRRINEDGSVVFDDGSVWRADPRMKGGATITVSDGTILSETGELLGYRARRESGDVSRGEAKSLEERVDEISEQVKLREEKAGTETGTDGASGGPEPLPKDGLTRDRPESNALLLLQQIDEGKLPVEEVAIGDVEAIAPTENGNFIEEYDAAKAKPIVVWEDLEGNRHAVTGGKRLLSADASGAETIKAVVVREADGWSEADARGLGATENLREGHGTIKNVVDAVGTLGEDKVAELAGWHQANGSRDFASTLRKGLAVAQKGAPELKAALAEGRIGDDFAYNAAQVLSMERVGEGWEAAQRELAELIGKVGPEELEAVLWGLKGRITPGGAGESGQEIDWKAAIAEERAKYNAKKGGADGKLDSDAVLMETEDGELKTLGEIEAENFAASGEAQDTASGEVEARSEEASNTKGVGRAEVSPRPDKVSVREKIKNFIKGLLPRKDGTVIKYKESDTDTRRLTEEATKAYNTYASKEYKLPTGGVLYFAPDARTVEAYGGDVGAAWGEYALHLVTHRRGKGDNLYRSFDGSSVDKVLPKIEEIIAANQVKVSDGRIVFFMQTVDGGSKNKSRYACLVTEPDANGNLRVDLRYVTGMQERGFLPGETVTLEEAIRNRTAEGRALHPDQPTTGSRSNTASAQSPESGSSIPNNPLRVNEGGAPNFAAAQGAAENKAVELRPAGDKPGVFTTLSHPEARFTVQGDASTAAVRTLAVEGLTEADFEPGRIGQTAALIAKVEAYAANHLMKIAFGDDGVQRLWETVRENIKAEGKEAYSAAQIESKRKAVLEQLKKSGLAEEVVESAEEFRRLYEEMNGEPLRRGEEVYGFCDPKTKKIYLNPEFFATQQGLEVPIHEFGHLGVIACEKVNKAVYDQGMKLAKELLESGAALATGTDGASGAPEPLPKEGTAGVRGLVDFILNDRVYSKQSRELQAQELLAQLIGKRGEEALKAETNKSVVAKVKSWLVKFWNTFGKALGLKDITPEEAAKMTLEDVADAIRAEMLSGRKYGEGFDRVEFSGGGARVKTKPVRIKRKMTGRRKAVNDFVARMGGAEDPTNTETDLLALWVDNGGRLFEKIPYALESGYSKGASGVKKVRSAVDDEFVESTSFYKDLNAAQRKVYFGTGKQEYGSVGGTLMERLEEAGITRFTGEDGMVDFNALIGEFERQWTNYERGEAFLKERGEWAEEHDRAIVEEMERAEAAERAELEAIFGKDEGGAAVSPEEAAAQDAQMAAELEAGMFSRKGGPLFARKGKGKPKKKVETKYSYDSLTAKPAMKVPRLGTVKTKTKLVNGKSLLDTDDILRQAVGNIEAGGVQVDGKSAVHVADLGRDVVVDYESLRHTKPQAIAKFPDVYANYGRILANSIIVNEASPADPKRSVGEYVAVGMAINRRGRPVFVRSVIDSRNGIDKISRTEVVYAVDARKGNPAFQLHADGLAGEGQSRAHVDDGIKPSSVSKSETEVSIADFLVASKGVFRDVFSQDVNEKLEVERDTETKLGKSLLFSRFAGEKGAANMGVGNADRARSMESEGADREKIWRETGWWKGKDGKWRFELPSARMKGEKEVEAALRINDRGSSETTLEKLLDAPELFKAYPQLKDTKITLSPEHNDEAGGWYDVRNNEIVLFDTGLKTLRHLPSRERGLRDTYQKVIDSDEYIRQRFENMDAFGIEHGTAEEEREYAKKWIERQDRNIRSANETMIRDLVKDRSAHGVFAKIVHEVQHAVQRIEGFARGGSVKEEDYARIAGEVEARNASRREAMSPEERAATPPWETEDVPQERQLLFSRKGKDGKETRGAELSDKKNLEGFRTYVKQIVPAPLPKRLESGSPRAALAWFEENMVGQTFSFDIPGYGHREFTPKPGHIGKLVCGGGKKADGTKIVKGRIAKANGNAALGMEMVRRGEVSSADVEGWDSIRAKSLPLVPVVLREFDLGLHEIDPQGNDIIIFAKKFTNRRGRSNIIVMKLVGDSLIGPISSHMSDMTSAWLKNKDLLLTDKGEVYNGSANNSASRSPSRGDNAEGNSPRDGNSIPNSGAGAQGGILPSRGRVQPPEAEHVKLTRVADDAGQGEQTPGAMAASRELSRQGAVPINTKGTRYVSLPMSEMNALARYLTGHALPAEMESGRKLGTAGKASYKHRKLTIAADVLGVVDKTDMAAEKAMLKQHGFFAHEDSNWCATHSPAEVRKERERSEEALSSRLEKIADKRIAGREPGGMAAGRKVFADQLAQVVMTMPHGQPGALGAMQTVAGALEKRVRGSETEAETFLDWMEGVSPGGAGASGRPARSAQERKAGMFAAFLIMPKEMEARAKGWYDAIRSTIAGDQKLADAFRKMTARMMSEQGHAHLESEILRMQDAQTEAAIKKLQAEANEPIKAGGKLDQAKETVVLSCDDRMGAAVVRVDAAAKVYLAAQKRLMAAAKTPAEKAQIKQQTDVFMGQLAQAKNQAELSRTAWERGRNNADARYLWRMVDLLNEATVRDGLRVRDLSLYLDQMRVIETRGLSGSRGESARQAQLIIDAMRKRLGADFAKVEAFARRFHAIHEQELLNNPLLEKILGKGTADYWRSQTSYVTTKRTFSPEELAEIEAARRVLAASGAAGGDTVVGQMFKYCGRPEATAKLKGSFADKQEVMSATFEKVAEVQRFLRRSEYVIRLRDMLKLANVEGVHDMPAGKNEFKSNNRYGSISYMENGQKRTLVVPKEIADGFDRQSMYNSRALKICASVNNVARQLWIDWNPVYWHRNLSRNAGSIEMNMPGMRESIIKRGARFVFPGLAPVTEMAMTHLVRHLPEKMSLGLRKIWGEHTALYYAPKAKRMAMWLTDHSEMQRRLWEAEKRGDLGAVQEMEEDRRDMLEALRANMLVGISAGKASGTAGFLDDSVKTVGKTMQREMQDWKAKSKFRKVLDTVNIFSKNAEQQVFEDIMAKFSAYLHDRAQFGIGNNRTAEESGLVVKKNVSIGEGERHGKEAGWVQGLMQPFWNMVEKGVVRNVKAYKERPAETFGKAAWRIAPMLLQGLIGSGAVAAWILKSNDGDEEKAKNGPMGDVYRYLRDAQRAYQNCSNYVRNNYHVTPLWTDGYTSIVIGMPLTDEERLLKPIARFVADAASVASGTKEQLEISEFLSDAYGIVAPDFKMAGALVTLLDDTVHPLFFNDNPHDYYTGSEKYDKDLYAIRNESWEMRGKFTAAMAKRLWNDFGGRNVLPVDRAGVDNGLGRAPGWVAKMVNDIPVASPILRSFVKVQVGNPKRDAAEITEAEARRRAVCRVCAKELFETAHKAKGDISLDQAKYNVQLQKWKERYNLTDDELADIEGRYLNAWRSYEGAQYRADGEREKYRAKAERLGLDAAHIWLDFD